MADDHSKEWKRADAEFAKAQNPLRPEAAKGTVVSPLDEKNARLKAARLARDATDDKIVRKGQS